MTIFFKNVLSVSRLSIAGWTIIYWIGHNVCTVMNSNRQNTMLQTNEVKVFKGGSACSISTAFIFAWCLHWPTPSTNTPMLWVSRRRFRVVSQERLGKSNSPSLPNTRRKMEFSMCPASGNQIHAAHVW